MVNEPTLFVKRVVCADAPLLMSPGGALTGAAPLACSVAVPSQMMGCLAPVFLKSSLPPSMAMSNGWPANEVGGPGVGRILASYL